MLSNTKTSPNHRAVAKLSNSALAESTTAALEAFIQAVKQGEDVVEKAQIYDAYQNERLRRLDFKKMMHRKRVR